MTDLERFEEFVKHIDEIEDLRKSLDKLKDGGYSFSYGYYKDHTAIVFNKEGKYESGLEEWIAC